MHHHQRAFKWYKGAVSLLAAAIFAGALLFGRFPEAARLELAVFFFLIFFSELVPIRIPGTQSEVTMTMPVVVGLFLSHGTASTIAVSAVAMFAASCITQRGRSWLWLADMAAFNTGIYVVSVALASLAYFLAGGPATAYGILPSPGEILLPLLVWVITYGITNLAFFSTGVALFDQSPWRLHFAETFRWAYPNFLISFPSGILFAYLYISYQISGILLVVVPFLVGRQALNQYAIQRDTYLETVTTLGSYMQQYHAYTEGHLQRVADLSVELGKEVGLPVSSLMFIREAGLLHDIGKVSVSDAILDKKGTLTDDEWNVIRQHPVAGAEILSQMKYLERVVPWVRGHHERPDGRGYPDALKDGEISLEAAVLAVADAFDAMAGDDPRVYRAPLTTDQAVDQVRYGVGTQFDPRVVKAFLKVMSRREEERGR